MTRIATRSATAALLSAIVLATSVLSAQAEEKTVGLSDLFPSDRQTRTTLVINKVLERFHYRNFKLDDEFARGTILNYFEDLDPNKSFFLGARCRALHPRCRPSGR